MNRIRPFFFALCLCFGLSTIAAGPALACGGYGAMSFYDEIEEAAFAHLAWRPGGHDLEARLVSLRTDPAPGEAHVVVVATMLIDGRTETTRLPMRSTPSGWRVVDAPAAPVTTDMAQRAAVFRFVQRTLGGGTYTPRATAVESPHHAHAVRVVFTADERAPVDVEISEQFGGWLVAAR